MGKAKANMWAESVISSFSEKTNKVYDDIASGKQQKTSGKMQKFDQELYSAILKALLSPDASPESEAVQLFNKLSSHKTTVQRSGFKALLLILDTVNGRTDSFATALIQEALTRRIIHNSP